MLKKKIISFSLWGSDLKYVNGALKNAELASQIYPDWICRFYIGQSTFLHLPNKITELKKLNNVEVIEMNDQGDWNGMFWRFYPCSDIDVQVMISRDTDSRLSYREKLAVDEWLQSKKDFHIMRDHHGHGTEILGGMWGVKNHLLLSMKKDIQSYELGNYWQIDQEFLRTIIYPKVKDKSFVHDPFFEGYPFPSKRVDYEFVGDVFDENNNRDINFKNDLMTYLHNNQFILKYKFLRYRMKKIFL